MHITVITYLIVCPLVFLAGLVDSIAGGGGIISLPAYLFAGLPVHFAIATNKLSSFCGTTIATGRYIKHRCYQKELAVPTIVAALAGSVIGAHLVLHTADTYLRYMLLFVLPVVAVIIIVKKNTITSKNSEETQSLTRIKFALAVIASFFIGMYDGFYGPGTGTFLMLMFTALIGLDTRQAAGNTKFVNWASNAAALVTFLLSGKVIGSLGAAAAVCSILGNYVGSGMVIKNGSKFVRPVIILVLLMLFIKILTGK